jgi:transcriptional regulator with XRE-family HTH domain
MLGVRLAALRKAAGMSQAYVAKELKISASAIGMYEQGRRSPSIELLAKMAELYGVSIDFLITGKAQSAQENQLLNDVLLDRVAVTDLRLENRSSRPFSRQELAVLVAAMLMEP